MLCIEQKRIFLYNSIIANVQTRSIALLNKNDGKLIPMKNEEIARQHTTNPKNPDDPKGIRDYFQRLIDHMPNNVYWLNRQCITMGCNKNTLKVLQLEKLEDFVGITYEDMARLANWTEGQAESFKRDDMEVMETGKPKINVEEPAVYDEEGKPAYYISSRVPLFDEKDEVIGVIGISVNITDKKELQKELLTSKENEARFKTLSAVGGMIAHELRTPLSAMENTVKGITQLIPKVLEVYQTAVSSGNVKDPIRPHLLDFLKESIDEIGQSLGYAQSTVNAILTGLHHTTGQQADTDTLATLSLKEVVDTALQQYPLRPEQRELIDATGVSDIHVKGEKQVIVHVLHNLLKNALHIMASCGKGEIKIYGIDTDDKAQLIFSDTAKGIPQEHLPHIFEPFYTTKKETAKSIGLGLYFCKMALEKTAAEITCESVLGKYTRFTITLPKA